MFCQKDGIWVTGCSQWTGGDLKEICKNCIKTLGVTENGDWRKLKDRPIDFRIKLSEGIRNLKVKPLRPQKKGTSLG